jgi:hypothetical protein
MYVSDISGALGGLIDEIGALEHCNAKLLDTFVECMLNTTRQQLSV